jgi:hypothetical protein
MGVAAVILTGSKGLEFKLQLVLLLTGIAHKYR